MIDSLSPLAGLRNDYSQIMPAAGTAASVKVQNEFVTIFYKELLKQVFKTPDFSIGDNEKESNVFSAFNSDMMAEQLAQQLAQKALLSQQWVLPAGEVE